MIVGLAIKDFRSLGSADLSVGKITSFVGANDAGKSNVLRALNLFFNGEVDHGEDLDFLTDYNRFATKRVNKAEQIEITLRLTLPPSYQREDLPKEVSWTKFWRQEGQITRLETRTFTGGEKFPPRSKIPALLDRIVFSYIPATKDRDFFSDLQGKIYDVLSTVAQAPLKDSADAFEGQLQAQLKMLLDEISLSISPDAKIRLPENLREIFESLEFSSDGIPLSRRGDGIKIRHIPMMLAFIAKKHDEVMRKGGVRYTHIWGFEEPENNVEMSAAFAMAEEICSLIADNDNIQLFITTHSPIFYRLDQTDAAKRTPVVTYFVERDKLQTKLTSRKPTEVDETLGLMPLVAPYVQEAKAQYLAVQESLRISRALLEKSIPTVFVEGNTDKVVLETAWRLFSELDADVIQMHSGEGDYGSANAVSSRVLAWLLETRHKRTANRIGVGAVFDKDAAGKAAHKKLQDDLSALNLTGLRQSILFYPDTIRLADLKRRGYAIPIDLEMHYSDAVWIKAENKGWLVERANQSQLLDDRIVRKLLEGKNPLDNLSVEDKRRFSKTFSDDGKIKAAQYVSGLVDAEQREALQSLSKIVVSMKKIVT